MQRKSLPILLRRIVKFNQDGMESTFSGTRTHLAFFVRQIVVKTMYTITDHKPFARSIYKPLTWLTHSFRPGFIINKCRVYVSVGHSEKKREKFSGLPIYSELFLSLV